MTVKIILNEKQTGPNKDRLADAELFFTDGDLEGLRLIGFAIWRRTTLGVTGNRFLVTFPARQYSVNGEKRSFAMLRPTSADAAPTARITDLIIDAYNIAVNALAQKMIDALPPSPSLTAAEQAALQLMYE